MNMTSTAEKKTLPDYVQTITVKDSNGQLRELIFPKGLDLDRPKRSRTTFSPEQLSLLDDNFKKNPYLVGRERAQLAKELGLSETQVKVWYQNRRTKDKKDKDREGDSISSHTNLLLPPTPNSSHFLSRSLGSQLNSQSANIDFSRIFQPPTIRPDFTMRFPYYSESFNLPTRIQQPTYEAHVNIVPSLRNCLLPIPDIQSKNDTEKKEIDNEESEKDTNLKNSSSSDTNSAILSHSMTELHSESDKIVSGFPVVRSTSSDSSTSFSVAHSDGLKLSLSTRIPSFRPYDRNLNPDFGRNSLRYYPLMPHPVRPEYASSAKISTGS